MAEIGVTRISASLLAIAAAFVLSACGQSVQTPLPDLSAPEPTLTASEGKQAIRELQKVNATKKAETIKEIEQSH